MIFGKDKLYATTAKLQSKLNYGFLIDWEKHWNQSLLIKLFVVKKSVSIEPDSRSTQLYNAQKDLMTLGAGIEQQYSSTLSVGIEADYADMLFYRGYLQDSSGLELIALPLLHLHPTLNYTLYERNPFRITAEAGFSYYSSASYDNFTVSPGYGYDLSIKLTQKFKNLNELSCKAYYQNRNQQTNLIDLNEKNLGMTCGYQWSF